MRPPRLDSGSALRFDGSVKLPLLREVAYPQAGAVPLALARGGRSPILESRERGPLGGRWSFVLWEPFQTLEWTFAGGWRVASGAALGLPPQPFDGLEAALLRLAPDGDSRDAAHGGPGAPLPPFAGGAVGWFAYELAAALEKLPELAARRSPVPAASWSIGDVVVALDHASGRAVAISQGWPAEGRERVRRAGERLEAACDAWTRACAAEPRADAPSTPPGAPPPSLDAARADGLTASLDAGEYAARFRRLHEYLEAGHIYQANLSVAYRVRTPVAPSRVYAEVLRANPAPYAAFLPGEGASVISASPELFLSRRGARLVTRPIKGTRPRGATPAEDARLAVELCASAKDRAEHVMIVDVHRNDLGRVARYGTVRVTAPWALESFASVHHLTSTIEAKLVPGLRPLDPVRAAFPAGSITGAPKLRAMEILTALEPHARGAYTGALGWIAPGGDCELAVAIRTLTVTPEGVEFPAGGGIVLDSTAESEYDEAWVKARASWAAIRAARTDAAHPPSLAAS